MHFLVPLTFQPTFQPRIVSIERPILRFPFQVRERAEGRDTILTALLEIAINAITQNLNFESVFSHGMVRNEELK